MRASLRVALGVALLVAAAVAAGAGAEEPLPERWRQWLEHDVFAIIAPEEREVFGSLPSASAREHFAAAFWQSRETAAGARGQLEKENSRRLAFVDQTFATPGLAGARSDRGRTYLLLGEPASRRVIEPRGGLRSAELWSYERPSPLLPGSFRLVFFRPEGGADLVLYHPVADGPEALVAQSVLQPLARYQALAVLRAADPEIASAALALVASAADDAGSPGLASEELIAGIEDLPRHQDLRYLRRFRAEPAVAPRGEERGEETTTRFELAPIVDATLAPGGIGWVSYDLAVPPADFALPGGGARTAAHLELLVVLSDGEGVEVAESHDGIELALDESQAATAAAVPMAIEGRLAVIPGSYSAGFLLHDRDTGRVGRGRAAVAVAAAEPSPRATIEGAYLAFHREPAPPSTAPLRPPFETASGWRMFPAREAVFSAGDQPWLVAAVRYPYAYGPPPRLIKTVSVTRDGEEVFGYRGYLEPNPASDGGRIDLVEAVRRVDDEPGTYAITLRIGASEEQALAERSFTFRIEAGPVARPWAFVREASTSGIGGDLARQFLNRGDRSGAAGEIVRLAASAPPEARLAAVAMLLDLGVAEAAERTVLPLTRLDPPPALALVYAGASLAMRGHYQEAAVYYERAMSGSNPGPALFNALADAYRHVGRVADARRLFARSLEIEPEQPEVREQLDGLPR